MDYSVKCANRSTNISYIRHVLCIYADPAITFYILNYFCRNLSYIKDHVWYIVYCKNCHKQIGYSVENIVCLYIAYILPYNTSYSSWQLCHIYHLTEYYDELNKLKSFISKMKDICDKIQQSMYFM